MITPVLFQYRFAGIPGDWASDCISGGPATGAPICGVRRAWAVIELSICRLFTAWEAAMVPRNAGVFLTWPTLQTAKRCNQIKERQVCLINPQPWPLFADGHHFAR